MIPLEICLGGRKMRAVQTFMDKLTGGSLESASFETPYGPIRIASENAQERVLAYCFFNILRHYKKVLWVGESLEANGMENPS